MVMGGWPLLSLLSIQYIQEAALFYRSQTSDDDKEDIVGSTRLPTEPRQKAQQHRMSFPAQGNDSQDPPYLTLTIPEAVVLPDPPSPEPRRFETLVDLLDHRATQDAQRTAVGFPSCQGTSSTQANCLQWTYSDLAQHSKALTHHLRDALGDVTSTAERGKQPVVAILAPSGPEFLLHAVACWRMGAAILPIALGTTADGISSLIQATSCKRLLVHEKQRDLAVQVERQLGSSGAGKGFQLVQWTQIGDVLSGVKPECAEALYAAGPDDTVVIFHSSGSTGNPKPIPQLIRFWTASLRAAAGTNDAAFTTTPLYHGGLSDLFRSLQAAAPIYFFAWHEAKAPTAGNVVGSVRACTQAVRFFLSVPFILEMLSKDRASIGMLQQMDLVSTGGAPLPEEVGDAMTRDHSIKLVSRMGSSECGFLMSSWRQFEHEKDWSWLRRPKEAGPEWLQFETQEEEPGVYELVVQAQWPTKLLSNRDGGQFATGDLYEQHQEHPDRWRYARRADDAIVMVNGKKIASAAVEGHFKATGVLDSVLVFGANRPLLGAIVLPASTAESDTRGKGFHHAFLTNFRPLLQDLNKKLPSHTRIPIEMVHIGDQKLFDDLPRSSKGTLQRGLALKSLASLIDGLYSRFEEGEAPSTEARKNLSGAELEQWLEALVAETCGHAIACDEDFFQNGVDSIMAARIRAAIHQKIDLAGRKLAPNVVYENPTIRLLAAHIEGTEGPNQQASTESIRHIAEKMVATYACQRSQASAKSSPPKGKATILLTGATGALGARILEILCTVQDVDNVVCLARAENGQAATNRIKRSLHDKHCKVDDAAFSAKVKCATGISGETRNILQMAERLVIIHCAWTVNFALRLESFEKDCIACESSMQTKTRYVLADDVYIQDLSELLELFVSSKHPSQLVFCSSLASVLSGEPPHQEQASENIVDAGSTGYSQSKWVAERICKSYDGACVGNVTVARVGQLCGDSINGIWNETEAWPLLVRTANELGYLPEQGPDVDWLPVDVAARSIVDLALPGKTNADIVHVALPQAKPRLSWPDFLSGLRQGGLHFKEVPHFQWLEAVKAAGTQVRGRALLEIWEKMPQEAEVPEIITEQAECASQTLRKATSVNLALCAKFVQAWRNSGFLS